jgi:2-oxoisovalerate dehydrogenase E2 component (dihydrolipoyl transacylase)
MIMGVHTVRMPDLGEGITEVEVVAWHVQVGDMVKEDQILADVMTDKASVELPSPVAGKVSRLGGEVGEVLAVGATLIDIALSGGGAADAAPAAQALAQVPVPVPATRNGASGITEKPKSAVAAAKESAQAAAPIQAEASPETATQPVAPEKPAAPSTLDHKPIASPALRRRAWELGIDLSQVQSSGAGGRILQTDLDAHVAQHGPQVPATTAPVATPRTGEDTMQDIKVIGLRRRIALKLQESKRSIPHFSYIEECDVTELESLRAQLNTRFGDSRGKLTLLPFLIRALVLAVADFPQINALFDDKIGVITRHSAVHVGIATQTDAGLMVPVLRHAQDGDLWTNAHAIVQMAELTRSGRATRDELTGSTITLTSLGALGGIVSTPIINAPEVAIVGVNRMVERPMVIGGQFVARKMMNLSSSFDHRVVDGQDAARFIQAVRHLLESPAALLVD